MEMNEGLQCQIDNRLCQYTSSTFDWLAHKSIHYRLLAYFVGYYSFYFTKRRKCRNIYKSSNPEDLLLRQISSFIADRFLFYLQRLFIWEQKLWQVAIWYRNSRSRREKAF